MLVNFNIYTPIEAVRACTPGVTSSTPLRRGETSEKPGTATAVATQCPSAVEARVTAESAWLGEPVSLELHNGVLEAAERVQSYLSDASKCETTLLFGYSQGAVVGIFSGSKVQNQGLASGVLQQFIDSLKSDGVRSAHMVQIGGPDSDYSFGIYAITNGSVKAVQDAVRSWSDGKPVSLAGFDDSKHFATSIFTEPAPTLDITGDGTSDSTSNSSSFASRLLHARADCKTAQVVSGDSCGTLAKKCGISAADFTKYNPSSTLCSTLQVGQYVCCSSGTLPDRTPKPNPDGTCAAYLVKAGDYCAKIASEHSLTVDKIEGFNKKTWGWTGCDTLQVGVNMCLR